MGSAEHTSDAYDRYHPTIQRWIYQQGWTRLHPVQQKAAAPIFGEESDVVIAAATAAGKTEAAFFPIATRIAEDWADDDLGAVSVLYVSPLKALINDQHDRLKEILSLLHIPAYRWHGDVSSSVKQRARKEGGVLLITPESLEAQLLRRGHEWTGRLKQLRYVVIDELHAFIGSERGRQLQSLLHRVELAARKRAPRIALSATLGDMDRAAEFLRPGHGPDAVQVVDESGGQTVHLQIRGYEERRPELQGLRKSENGSTGGASSDEPRAAAASDASSKQEPDESTHDTNPSSVPPASEATRSEAPEAKLTGSDEQMGEGTIGVAKHLFRTVRGGRHIVFANRREDVEAFSDLLQRLANRAEAPDDIAPHHGSLSRRMREETEWRLRRGQHPTTVVATSTLELGIDVGSVESIGQIGPPPSVASMRQRLGRSGRRGDPSIFRLYVREDELTPESSPITRLRVSLVRAIAMVRLLIDGWFEPPITGALHLSTLVQQTLSLIGQHGGLNAKQGYDVLCRRGPFRSVSPEQYAALLRDLGASDLIKQTHAGDLVLDLSGEQLVNHYDFYAAFSSPDEFRLIADGETLGSLPLRNPVEPGSFLIFGGQRWEVLSVNLKKRIIRLQPAGGGKPPRFAGSSGILIRSRVREEMRVVYEGTTAPSFLSTAASSLLEQGRSEFRDLGLEGTPVRSIDGDIWWFPWTGDRALNALLLEMRTRSLKVTREGPALMFKDASAEDVKEVISAVEEDGLSEPIELAHRVENKSREKHHRFLRDELLAADYASADLDMTAAREVLSRDR